MKLQEAINRRIIGFLKEQKWSVNKLAERAGIAPSSLKRTLKPYATVKNTTTGVIFKICTALEIPFREFWDSELFDNLEIEDEE